MLITRKGMAPVAALGVVVGLSGCAVNSQPAAVPQQTTTTQTATALQRSEFASLDSARQAVARVIGCDDKPKTDPIINPDLAGFTPNTSSAQTASRSCGSRPKRPEMPSTSYTAIRRSR